MMNYILWAVIGVAAIYASGWLFRFAGRKIDWPRDNLNIYFRDVGLTEAAGFILGLVAVYFVCYYYFIVESTFFRWAVQGFIIATIAAYAFWWFGKLVGTDATRKLFRQMPLTAAFGILIILIYVILAIFAGAIAPHGQEDIFEKINVLPGGDLATGGDPAFPLGTDQLGRDLLSRLIYGAQNTVGIAFVTTLLAFFIGTSIGFLAATVGGWIDQVASRAVDALMAIPQLIFALLLMTIATAWAGSDKTLVTLYMIIIIAVLDSTRVFRLARGRPQYRRHGLHRGRQGTRRKTVLPHLQRNTAQCDGAAAGRIRSAFLLRLSDHRRPVLPRHRHPAAAGRLGHDGARSVAVHQFCPIQSVDRRLAVDGRRRDCAFDGCGQLRGRLDVTKDLRSQGVNHERTSDSG